MWRPEDEALLERLEDERLLEAVWAREAPGAPPPHPRASSLMRHLRGAAGAGPAFEASRRGDMEPLARLVREVPLPGLPPELLHHLALLEDRIAEALAGVPGDAAIRAAVRSLAAWLALAEEGRYLEELVVAIAGRATGDPREIAAAQPLERLEALGERARAGAREESSAAAMALATLARAPHAVPPSGASKELGLAFVRRAARLRSDALEEALAPLAEAIAEAGARGAAKEMPRLFERVAELWRFAEEDEAIEQFAVDQVTPIAWEHHQRLEWDALRALLAPVAPLGKRLAARVAADPSRIAYAAPAAQFLVFLAELETGLEDRRALAEHAVAICPVHRNGRVVLAGALLDSAVRMLDQQGWNVHPAEVRAASELVGRAEALWPTSSKLARTKEKLAASERLLSGRGL